MISFESDYNNGMLPEILTALAETNNEKTSGYGFDPIRSKQKRKSARRWAMTRLTCINISKDTQNLANFAGNKCI